MEGYLVAWNMLFCKSRVWIDLKLISPNSNRIKYLQMYFVIDVLIRICLLGHAYTGGYDSTMRIFKDILYGKYSIN